MSTCNTVLPNAITKDGTVDVVSKINILAKEVLGTDSVYMRAKDTFKELFIDKQMNDTDYATMVSQFVGQLATTTTQQVVQGAIQWAIKEKELMYSLPQTEAQTELLQAQRAQVGYEICKIDKEIDLQCANTTAVLSASIRDNGRVDTRDPNNACIPLTLVDEGVKYDQKAVYQAQTYAALADAYRKSGVVQIGVDTDNVSKGVAGTATGYTDAQDKYARRQILSFEDSKRTHAVNALSQTIGQLLATDIVPDQSTIINKFNNAIDYLNTNTPST